mgnify:CR=1 FL=1
MQIGENERSIGDAILREISEFVPAIADIDAFNG